MSVQGFLLTQCACGASLAGEHPHRQRCRACAAEHVKARRRARSPWNRHRAAVAQAAADCRRAGGPLIKLLRQEKPR